MSASLLVGLALVVGAPAKKDSPAKEPPSLVGEWAAVSGVSDGKPDNPEPGTTITFTADGKVLLKEGKDDRKDEQVTYKCDPKKDPAEIEIVPPAKEKEPTMLGIYKIEGDKLILCLSMGGERPKEFASAAGSKFMLVTCKRAKKE